MKNIFYPNIWKYILIPLKWIWINIIKEFGIESRDFYNNNKEDCLISIIIFILIILTFCFWKVMFTIYIVLISTLVLGGGIFGILHDVDYSKYKLFKILWSILFVIIIIGFYLLINCSLIGKIWY